jgi:hypothetical protein
VLYRYRKVEKGYWTKMRDFSRDEDVFTLMMAFLLDQALFF